MRPTHSYVEVDDGLLTVADGPKRPATLQIHAPHGR